jgi:DNA (cytosine-5)-methyltransferase 1
MVSMMHTPYPQLTVGSLFSGIGGLDLGLERAGMQIVWQCEIDAYARRVLARHWPDVTRFRDVREVGAHHLTPVDLICGGFPCQDISEAGKKAGITGARSSLWKEFCRIVCALRPRYVLVENVAALTRRGLGVVLGDLAACGYDAEWQCLPAAAVGAPHERARLFIVAYTDGDTYIASPQSSFHCTASAQTSPERLHCHVADADRLGWKEVHTQPGLLQETQSTWGLQSSDRDRLIFRGPIPRWNLWADESGICRVADGIPARVDRLRGLGNAVVPQVAEYIGRCILQHAQQNMQRGGNL